MRDHLVDGARFVTRIVCRSVRNSIWLLKFRPTIITDGWVIRPQSENKFNLFGGHGGPSGGFGFPQNLSANHKIAPLFPCEVTGNQITVGAPKIINVVGSILSNVDFPVRIGDLENDVHAVTFLAGSRTLTGASSREVKNDTNYGKINRKTARDKR